MLCKWKKGEEIDDGKFRQTLIDAMRNFGRRCPHEKEGGDAYVSTILFDDKQEVIYDRVKLSDVKRMTEKNYWVRGITALIDAIGGAIHHIVKVHKSLQPQDVPTHTIFVIITDGMENASRRYSSNEVKSMIEHKKKKYGWEFLFIGANIDSVASHIGISPHRAVNYIVDSEGTNRVYEGLSKAMCCVSASYD